MPSKCRLISPLFCASISAILCILIFIFFPTARGGIIVRAFNALTNKSNKIGYEPQRLYQALTQRTLITAKTD